jgi:hypothetical protein
MFLLQHLSHMQSEKGRCLIRSANSGLARLASQPLAGAYFFGEFLAAADSLVLPRPHRRSHRCYRRAALPSEMAAANKCLAQSNKSRTGGEATKNRFAQLMGIG